MDDTTSSRTPEGLPQHCPVCEAVIRIALSGLTGEVSCPRCGRRLWFIRLPWVALYPAEAVTPEKRRRVVEVLRRVFHIPRENPERVGSRTSFVEDIGTDSLDLVELLMELEEEFGVGWKGPPDVNEWLNRHLTGRR
jgi:acyl carrier protein